MLPVSMHTRFYAPGVSSGRSTVDLPREEAEHLSRVLRLRPGDPVQVFDGSGREFSGKVGRVGRTAATVILDGEVTPVPEPSVRLTLVQAVPKGDAMDRIVRDATMLGIAAILPLVSARAEVSLHRLEASGRVGRWQRIAVASVKQCGRAVVPAVLQPETLDGCFRRVETGRRFLLAEPGLLPVDAVGVRGLSAEPAPASALLVVGPEGGWTADEVDIARGAACTPLTLGPRTLRADAAAVVAITALLCVWGDL
jgi:16S rRNA (uracil1498-N3)-methyltransferase